VAAVLDLGGVVAVDAFIDRFLAQMQVRQALEESEELPVGQFDSPLGQLPGLLKDDEVIRALQQAVD
jgi:hypothetical protein